MGLPDVPATRFVQVLVPAGQRLVSSSRVRVLPTQRGPQWWVGDGGVRFASTERCVVDAPRALGSLGEVRALVIGAVGCGATTALALRQELEAGGRAGSGLCRHPCG